MQTNDNSNGLSACLVSYFMNQVLMLCSRLDDIAFELLASVKGFLQRADNLDLSHPSARNLRHPAETGWPMPKTDTYTYTRNTFKKQ